MAESGTGDEAETTSEVPGVTGLALLGETVAFAGDEAETTSEVPGVTGLALLGETVAFASDAVRFIDRRREQYGALFQTHLFGSRTVVACCYHSATAVLRDEQSVQAADAFAQWLRDLYPAPNLLLCADDAPTRARQLLLVQRCLRHPARFSDRAAAHIARHLRLVAQRARSTASGWASWQLYRTFKPVVERAVTAALLGHLPDHRYALIRRLCSDHFNGVAAVPVALHAFGLRSARATARHAYQQLTQQLSLLLHEHLRRPQPHPHSHSALADLAHMVRHRTASPDDAVQVLLTLLSTAVAKAVASAATTATATLAEHRHAPLQQRILHELRHQHGHSHTLHAVILEALRLYPPLPATIRVATADSTVSRRRLRAGSSVWLSLLHANRDHATFESACTFDPHRWHNHKLPTPLSFGAGNRLCKGRDVAYKMLNAMLAAVLTAVQLRGPPLQSAELRYLPVLRPAHDRPVLARPRST